MSLTHGMTWLPAVQGGDSIFGQKLPNSNPRFILAIFVLFYFLDHRIPLVLIEVVTGVFNVSEKINFGFQNIGSAN